MGKTPPELAEGWVILSEGEADENLIAELLRVRGINGFQVGAIGGLPRGNKAFAERLIALQVQSGFAERVRGIVIVSDNDLDPADSFAKIAAQIREAKDLPVPTQPREVATLGGIKLAIVMLPWDNLPGALESLCIQAAESKWPEIVECVEEYAECAGTNGWGVNQQAKMKLRCIIAAVCDSDPNTSLIYLWSRNPKYHIPLSDSVFDQLANFFLGLATS